MKKYLITLITTYWVTSIIYIFAYNEVTITNPETWTTNDITQYVGQTVKFTNPFIVCNNYYYNSGSPSLTISTRRIFSPTNQVMPGDEYRAYQAQNEISTVTLYKTNGYHRMGERIVNLVAKITSKDRWDLVSCDYTGNTRNDLLANTPNVDKLGTHTLLVCAMNLEYYLTEAFGTGSSSTMGPADNAAHQKQRAKTSAALSKINADIYGFVEIQQGQGAISEIASDLTRLTGRPYKYINDKGTVNGTYTKAGYVYCTATVEPHGIQLKAGKRMTAQCFVEKATGEKFVFSLNHLKAKSGTGTGANADQHDGQGIFNAQRTQEATEVLNNCKPNTGIYTSQRDNDILLMGDLNAYAKEDPVQIFVNGGFIDLHRYFHADSSYSHTFRGTAGYLDHAMANSGMLPQVTGMSPYHINSDEHDNFTYNSSNDATMFRSSDHDPILVGLKLGGDIPPYTDVENLTQEEQCYISYQDGVPTLYNAQNTLLRIYAVNGQPIVQKSVLTNEETLPTLPQGLYFVAVNGQVFKILIH